MSKFAARIAAFALTLAIAAQVAFAADRTNVAVAIEPSEVGIVTRFALDRPVLSFTLEYPEDEFRDRTWKFQDSRFKREGALISRIDGAPFDNFAVDIAPLNEPLGATYPCLIRIGTGGYAFYAGYFIGVESEFTTTIEVAQAPDRAVVGLPLGADSWRVEPAFHRSPGHRYVYLGPRSLLIETRRARYAMPTDLAPDMASRIRENVDGAIAYYARKLARPLQTKPLIIVAPNYDYAHPGAQGDTTMGPAIALRFFGGQWKTFDPKSDRVDHLIAHETAHIWNSDTYHAAKRSPSWLWEGGAEFLALQARVAVMKRLTREGRRAHIEAALNKCLRALFDQAMNVPRAGANYVCGETVYWIADAAEKKRSGGRGDIFAIWRRIFDRADANGGVYSLVDFLTVSATSEDAARALSMFLSDTGGERWQTLPEVLKPIGIEIAEDKAPQDDYTLRYIAMWHILDMACTGARGMRHETDYLKLDTGDRCGPLSGDPEIDTLNGHNLYTDMPAAYAAAQSACSASGDIVLARTGKPGKWALRCTKPLAAAPPRFRIASAP